ncbi:hypothetical protein [Caulobacter sp.]|uniref:hypothetical protein n=1 Tax=Caulobacter sp. TaxID=78 RepID=UPI003BB11267
MRLCLFLILSLAGMPVSAQAAQSPIFGMFKRICLDTRGAPDGVAQATANWTPVDIPPIFNPLGAPFDQATVRSQTGVAEEDYLVLWGIRQEAEVKRWTCNLAGPGDKSNRAAARAWIGGLKPLPGSDQNLGSYLAIETPNGRRAPSQDEISDLNNASRLIVLTIATEGDVTTFSVSRFTASTPTALDGGRR